MSRICSAATIAAVLLIAAAVMVSRSRPATPRAAAATVAGDDTPGDDTPIVNRGSTELKIKIQERLLMQILDRLDALEARRPRP